MSRLQLALNVSDIDAAIDFYSKLFGTEPVKRHPGYANFAIAEPSLKLVLFENPGATSKLNHLGIELESSEEVMQATERLKQSNLRIKAEPHRTCCYALQDKIWVSDPDGDDWEVYTVLEDSKTFAGEETQANA
ncbi:MAG: ArsI/CadI family heavy metal resistance metalloenzyme [Rivularia sp. (in: cyanobacteria)]